MSVTAPRPYRVTYYDVGDNSERVGHYSDRAAALIRAAELSRDGFAVEVTHRHPQTGETSRVDSYSPREVPPDNPVMPGTMTTADIAQLLGLASAPIGGNWARRQHLKNVNPTGGLGGRNLYATVDVLKARAAMPGSGNWTSGDQRRGGPPRRKPTPTPTPTPTAAAAARRNQNGLDAYAEAILDASSLTAAQEAWLRADR